MIDKSPEAFRTISEVGADLNIPQHVLRFWETRFTQIRPLKRSGGRRYYRPDDIDLIKAIRHLLYGQGYTIRGVQRILKEQGVKAVIARALDSESYPDGAEAAPVQDSLSGAVIGVDDSSHKADLLDHDHAESGSALADEVAEENDPSRLSFEDVRRLKTALFELNDGIKLLRQALGEQE